jgi:hypothetical protein
VARPTRRTGDSATLPAYPRVVVFYAVVCNDIEQVLQFFGTQFEAERMLARVLVNEPDWEDVLQVEPVELVTGGLN